jgi:O-antigen biosynthesis protein
MKNQSELLRALRKELQAKEKELADQKWVFEQFLQSPSWRWTAPIRWAANRVRSLRNGHGPATSEIVADASPQDSIVEAEQDATEALKSNFTALCSVTLESFLNSGATLHLPNSLRPRISIVLVLFNRAELTLACLRSIAENHSESLEVVIVDNASADATSRLLERVHGARILRNPENLHFLAAVNQAARECRGEHILLLNNDSQLLPGTIRNALATMQTSPEIGAVGGKIILLDGALQEAGSIVWQNGSCTGYGRGDNPFAPMYNFRRDVDYCSGAFLLTPRAVWERLGGFDEAFKPAYYEETDYCMRLWENGLRVVYEPTAAIVHYEFGSAESAATAIGLQSEHQALFEKRHHDVLQKRDKPATDRLLEARSRDRKRRILFLDDRVPHLWLGSGFPRAHAFVTALLDQDCFVTLYPLARFDESWDAVYADFPCEIEVMNGWGRQMLESFLRTRNGYYSGIVVSRPHNMELLAPIIEAHPGWFEHVEIIYDAEALFASRTIALRELSGEAVSEDEARDLYGEEICLSGIADRVVAVSEHERKSFLTHGIEHVEVLGHSLVPSPSPQGFGSRSGLLFVGAVHEEASPNGDSLIWFLEDVYPKIRAALGDIPVTIAGVNESQRIRELASPPVKITGPLPSLEDLYAQHRLFIAPTRYAAGIPHKIHEAAAHGLPVVTTPLLARQLDWTDHELAIGGGAAGFAHQCIALYNDAERWTRLRNAALERVQADCSPNAFAKKVGQILAAARK